MGGALVRPSVGDAARLLNPSCLNDFSRAHFRFSLHLQDRARDVAAGLDGSGSGRRGQTALVARSNYRPHLGLEGALRLVAR